MEALVVSVLYQFGKQLIMQVTQWSMQKLDELVSHQNLGRRLVKENEEMVPLTEFDIGDVLVVKEGETIPLGGKIIKGKAKLDVYAIDGSDVYQKQQLYMMFQRCQKLLILRQMLQYLLQVQKKLLIKFLIFIQRL